jgi:hypothetical protein
MLLKAAVVRTAADEDLQVRISTSAHFYKVQVSGIVSISNHFDNLDVVSTSVIENGDFYRPYLSWFYTELNNSEAYKPLVFLLNVVSLELRVWNACI